jgi:hypothetical protein
VSVFKDRRVYRLIARVVVLVDSLNAVPFRERDVCAPHSSLTFAVIKRHLRMMDCHEGQKVSGRKAVVGGW